MSKATDAAAAALREEIERMQRDGTGREDVTPAARRLLETKVPVEDAK